MKKVNNSVYISCNYNYTMYIAKRVEVNTNRLVIKPKKCGEIWYVSWKNQDITILYAI